MKKSILGLLVFLSLVGLTFAQEESELDKLMIQRRLHWDDISYNCSFLVQKYFEEAKYDSVEIILDYWEDKNGLSGPLFMAKTLIAIYQDTYSEDLSQQDILTYLLTYKPELREDANDSKKLIYLSYPFYDICYNPIHPAFEEFLKELVQENLIRLKEGDVRYLICKFYNNEFDFVFNELKSGRYDHTELKKYYDLEIQKTLSEMEGHIGYIAGAWFPQGESRILGNHPTLGCLIGFKKKKFLYDLTTTLRFLNSPNKYNILHKNSVIETDDFLGYYIGLELGREIYRNKRNEFDFVLGTGYDCFTAYSNEDDKEDAKNIGSFNFNVGIGYRHYFSDYSTRYIGFQARMNFVDYDNRGGTDLSGNSISLRFICSFSKNIFKYKRLKELKYDF